MKRSGSGKGRGKGGEKGPTRPPLSSSDLCTDLEFAVDAWLPVSTSSLSLLYSPITHSYRLSHNPLISTVP